MKIYVVTFGELPGRSEVINLCWTYQEAVKLAEQRMADRPAIPGLPLTNWSRSTTDSSPYFTSWRNEALFIDIDEHEIAAPATLYVIAQDRDEADSYWNIDSGWGCLETADVFNQEERDQLDLPMYGRWVELPQRKV